MRNVIFENTEYSLFIYFLITDKWENDIFFLEDSFYDRISNNFIAKNIDVRKINKLSGFGLNKNTISYYLNRISILLFLLKNKNNIKIYGNDSLINYPFFIFDINVLEDGTINYHKPLKSNLKKLLIYTIVLRSIRDIFGFGKEAKKIYLTGITTIPKEIRHKVEIINLKQLWDKKDEIDKVKILDIFNIDLTKIKLLQKYPYILFTQPLSEDLIISEAEKIEIYTKIIKNYDENKLIIKKHPREKTNYQKYFPNILILEENFPAELFSILGINFTKAITIFSTAALNLGKDVEIDFYGTEIHHKIFKSFNSMDKIFKRNKYLSEDIE